MRVLAIKRASIGELRGGEAAAVKPERRASAIDVYGPLYKFAYEYITEMYELALSEAAGGVVVLAIDSPGGYVTGCFEACFDLRRIRAKYADTKVIVFSDGMLCSGAYAIASAATSGDADEIVLTPQAEAGSVGVIATRLEIKPGENYAVHYFTWPEESEKAAGYPDTEMTEAEATEIQAGVTAIGETFAQLVADTRGISVADVAALRARTYMGAAAIEAGLADRIVQSRAALSLVATEPDDETTDPESENEPDPNSEDDMPTDAPTTPDEGAQTPASSQEVATLREELRVTRVGAMLAARPDVPEAVRALLAPQQPEQVQAMLAAMPLPVAPPRRAVLAGVDPITPGNVPGAPDAQPGDEIDAGLERSTLSAFDTHIPRKAIAAGRKVERDDVHGMVHIR